MTVYAIIPARSGSKGFKNKNIQLINGRPLLSYSISFAKKLHIDKVICSTDSEIYSKIAQEYGAEVPFLRSEFASDDTAMEEDILQDLKRKFEEYKIDFPDILVWLRPTFVFRDLELIKKGIHLLKNNAKLTSVRTVCETEGRIYSINENSILSPKFDDFGRSMIRRQDVGKRYKVFSTDIFRFNKNNLNNNFLGNNIFALETSKICGMDIDDELDFKIVKYLAESKIEEVVPFIH